MTKTELKKALTFAETTARSAGEILKLGFHKKKQIRYKGVIDPVTEYDLKSEKHIVAALKKNYPDHGILSEEGDNKKSTDQYRWVIDPLDGTVNYAHKMPVYAVSIALMENDDPIVGVVYDPEKDEMFSAVKNGGAFLNGKKISVSKESKLNRSLLATGFAYNIKKAKKNNLGTFARMMKQAQAVRRLGSAALDLCWLADGRFEGFWEYYLHPWDTAAAILIVTEAGGKVTGISKDKYTIFDDNLLASNNLIHQQMRQALTSKMKK